MQNRRHFLTIATSIVASAFFPGTGLANDINWQGGTADYTNAASWVGGVVPGAGDNAINDNGTNNVVRINTGNPNWTVNDIRAGNGAGNGAWLQNGPNLALNGWFRLGIAAGNTGVYTLNSGTLTMNNGGNFNLGESGTGMLNLNGGTLNVNGARFGLADGPSGATGIVTQVAGTVNVTGEIQVGNNAGRGFYTLSNGTITAQNWLTVGRGGAVGIFTMTGGTITKNGSGNFQIGSLDGGATASVGTFNQSGGTINVATEYWIGEAQNAGVAYGTNNISGTAMLIVDNWFSIGREGGVGVLNISGGAVTKKGNSGNHFIIGDTGSGTGTINQTGGAVTNITSDTWLGANKPGTWNLNAGSAVLAQIIFGVNSGGNGTLNLNGGTLTTTGMTSGSGTNEYLNLNGGTLRAGAGARDLINNLTQTTVGAGGVTVDSAGQNVFISQSLLDNGGGGLTKNGSGALSLTGANTYHGNNVVNAGKLLVGTYATGGGSFTVADGAGMGVIVNSTGGQLTASAVTLASSTSATLDFNFGSFGASTMAPLKATGTLAVNGVITVNILSNSVMQIGEFPLIKYGSRIGSGSFVLGSLPWGAQASIITNAASSTIDLIVSVAPAAGVISANFDGQTGTGWAPPDGNAAVGPNHIVCWGNNSFTILNKNGGFISSIDATTFFGFSTGGDGHVIYDEISGRFAFEVLSTNNSVGFAVSDTSDPTGPWHKINISVPGLWDGFGGNGIGYNADAYVVHVNGFNNQYAVIAASNNVNLAYTLITAPGSVRIGRPCSMTTATTGGPFYFVEGNSDGVNGQGGIGGNIEVVKISNILSGSPTYADYQVSTGTSSVEVFNVTWRNNLLGLIGGSAGGGVTWYLLSTTNTPALLQGGTIYPESNGEADVPSICVAPNGSLAVNYTSAYLAADGSDITTMYVAGRLATDPAGTMRPPRQVVTGPTTDGRWGDYSSCVADINAAGVAQNSFWACNEYLTSPGMFNWRDRLVNFSIPAPSAIAVAGSLYVDLRASDLIFGTTTWTNRTGMGNFTRDGTSVPVLANNQGVWSVQLDGTDGYKGPNTTASLLSGSAPRTIEAWANNPAIGDEETMVALGQRGATDHSFAFNYGSNPGYGAMSLYSDDLGWKSIPAANAWHYLVATYDGTNLLVYRDGTLDNSATRTAATTVGPIWIGSQTSDGVNPAVAWFSGNLNSIRIHTGALSRDQIAANYAMGISTLTAPVAPAGLAASPGNAQVALAWNATSGATGYNIKSSTTSGGPYSIVAKVAGTNYTHTGLINGTTYYYVVTATNLAGESANSTQASAMPVIPIPSAPTGLAATATTTQVNLSWNSGSGATGYNVKRSTTNGGPYTVVGNTAVTTYADTAVINGLTYYYVASATNSTGESANSLPAGVTMPLVTLATGGMPTNGQFNLQFQAANNQAFVVQTSTNLMNWKPLATNITVGGMFNYTDFNATNPVQFYRVSH